jgi:orotate phosphoribosyltransferase
VTLQDDLVACGAIRFGQFKLTSGKTSTYYVDVKKAMGDPKVLAAIGQALATKTQGADILAGLELGAVPVLVAASLASGKPMAILRKGERAHGTGQGIEGAQVAGRRVLIIEDVTTSGGSVAGVVERLRQAGATVVGVETVVDRNEGSRERLAALKVPLGALVEAKSLLNRVEAKSE